MNLYVTSHILECNDGSNIRFKNPRKTSQVHCVTYWKRRLFTNMSYSAPMLMRFYIGKVYAKL
jgi:hypothetical protein